MIAAPRPGPPGPAPAGPGLLLIAHGSRDRRHARAIAALADAVRAGLPGVAVETGFLSLSEPSVTEAYGRLLGGGAGREDRLAWENRGAWAERGRRDERGAWQARGVREAQYTRQVTEIRVVPLFLRAGYHVQHDVPEAVAAARREFPAPVRLTVARALGPDRLVTESFERRVREAGCWPGDPRLDVIPAGATKQTEVDPAALMAPYPPGMARRLVLARFLAPGELPDRARARAAAAGVPITEPLISEIFGPAPELVRLVETRYREDLSAGEGAPGAGTGPANRFGAASDRAVDRAGGRTADRSAASVQPEGSLIPSG